MAQKLRYPTTQNFIQKTLGSQLLAGTTSAATLNNVTGIQNLPGVMVVDRVDTNGVETPSKREVIQYDAISGVTVTTLTRNADGGGTTQDHAVGAIVEFGPDILWAQALIDGLSQVIDPTTGLVDATKVIPSTYIDTDGTLAANLDTKLASQKAVRSFSLNHFLSRQAILNGNFDVWQRGTTVTNPANSVFITDRWKINTAADGGTPPTLIHSQQILTPGDIANAYYFYRINPNGAGSSFGVNSATYIQQNIENGTRLLAGLNKKVTISFWARSSIANKRLGFSLFQTYGTGGSPSALESIKGDVVTLTSTWTKYTFTFTLNTLVGKTFGTANDDYISLLLWGQWGTTVGNTYLKTSVTAESFVGSGNIDIAQVQLCAGDVALPFMAKSFEEELRACKRYFQIYQQPCLVGWANSNVLAARMGMVLPVEMRVAPTPVMGAVVIFDTVTNTPALSIATDYSTTKVVEYDINTAAALTAGRVARVAQSGTATLALSAEL